MVTNAMLPKQFRMTFLSQFRKIVIGTRREIHYIGGSEVLPAPLEMEEESAVIKELATETTDMVIKSVDAFVQKDMDMAHWVIKEDDVVDDLFNQFKQQLIKKINENVKNGEQATDMLMVAKYFERIGDHATNIAEWVIYSITGQHEN